jgi:hypothetical protein
VTVALVVLPTGVQFTAPLPPPVAEPMHWLTVTFVVDVAAGTLLVTVTLQCTSLPPPLTMLLHWLTEVTSWLDVVVVTTVRAGTRTRLSGQEG